MQPSKMGGGGDKNFHKIVWIEQNEMYFIAVKEHTPHNVMFLVCKLQLTAAPDEQNTLVV